MPSLIKKVFGSANAREIGRILPVVDRVNALEKELVGLSDARLQARNRVYDRVAASPNLEKHARALLGLHRGKKR